ANALSPVHWQLLFMRVRSRQPGQYVAVLTPANTATTRTRNNVTMRLIVLVVLPCGIRHGRPEKGPSRTTSRLVATNQRRPVGPEDPRYSKAISRGRSAESGLLSVLRSSACPQPGTAAGSYAAARP